MKKDHLMGVLIGVLIAAASIARAENWPQWRGPAFNGSSTEKNLPEKLDEKDAAWSVELAGRGASTPIVFGDRVFVSVQGADRKLMAVCYDAKAGNELWHKDVGMAGNNKGN